MLQHAPSIAADLCFATPFGPVAACGIMLYGVPMWERAEHKARMDLRNEKQKGIESGYWNSRVEEEARCLVREAVKRLKGCDKESGERAEFVLKDVMGR